MPDLLLVGSVCFLVGILVGMAGMAVVYPCRRIRRMLPTPTPTPKPPLRLPVPRR